LHIRVATPEDLRTIASIERSVEDPRLAASIQLLQERLFLYPQGFLVAVLDNQIVGYLESIRWDGSDFERFDDIKDYKLMHRELGDVLYIAFMAVDPAFRNRGFASQLMARAQKRAIDQEIKKIQLVALPKLVGFYERLGFGRVRILPCFLDNSLGELMEKMLRGR
jgi:ribosomal protein S18 acetylase RimI-like enzyme